MGLAGPVQGCVCMRCPQGLFSGPDCAFPLPHTPPAIFFSFFPFSGCMYAQQQRTELLLVARTVKWLDLLDLPGLPCLIAGLFFFCPLSLLGLPLCMGQFCLVLGWTCGSSLVLLFLVVGIMTFHVTFKKKRSF